MFGILSLERSAECSKDRGPLACLAARSSISEFAGVYFVSSALNHSQSISFQVSLHSGDNENGSDGAMGGETAFSPAERVCALKAVKIQFTFKTSLRKDIWRPGDN